MTKISEDIRLLVGRELKGETWDLDALLLYLRGEVENRERCGGIQALAATETKKPYSPHGNRNIPSTAAALLTGETRQGINCTFCREAHPTSQGHVITNRDARRQILKKQGRCFICLKRNHIAKDGASRNTCFKCSGRHHVSLRPSGTKSRRATITTRRRRKPGGPNWHPPVEHSACERKRFHSVPNSASLHRASKSQVRNQSKTNF